MYLLATPLFALCSGILKQSFWAQQLLQVKSYTRLPWWLTNYSTAWLSPCLFVWMLNELRVRFDQLITTPLFATGKQFTLVLDRRATCCLQLASGATCCLHLGPSAICAWKLYMDRYLPVKFGLWLARRTPWLVQQARPPMQRVTEGKKKKE